MIFVFWLFCAAWDLSSATRDGTHAPIQPMPPAVEAWSLHQTTGEALEYFLKKANPSHHLFLGFTMYRRIV